MELTKEDLAEIKRILYCYAVWNVSDADKVSELIVKIEEMEERNNETNY